MSTTNEPPVHYELYQRPLATPRPHAILARQAGHPDRLVATLEGDAQPTMSEAEAMLAALRAMTVARTKMQDAYIKACVDALHAAEDGNSDAQETFAAVARAIQIAYPTEIEAVHTVLNRE